MNGDSKLYEILKSLNIPFDYYEHPPVPTVKEAEIYWKDLDASHCKNLFFRNHKGNRHYLVIFDYRKSLSISELEQKLKQGKLSFASELRMEKYLGLKPGSVSPFGLIHDTEKHVYLFIDKELEQVKKISFHPNLNTASLVINNVDFKKFLNWCGNSFEYLKLYD
ncbi:MAG: prolyl-tRNA editing protein [Bacteroidetes bacterium GWA2_30_7]|nr:MAG: prolyl-tRNA editing protein [Bacteroidetes bacterium GWA2_30_7]